MTRVLPGDWRRLLAGLLLVTLFTLPALSPLWSLTLPQSYDGLHRLHRLIEFDQAVHHGVLLPRWTPDFVYGYGYPVFNFFPYADYYLPELLHLLGLAFSQALAAAFLLYTLLAGWSLYLLVRDLLGEMPALLAAVAYVYAPYQLHNSLVRGNLPEQLGLALFPLLLWALGRLIRRRQRRWFVASAVLYTAFLLSHTALDLILTPVLLLYLAVQKPTRPREPLLALLLGGGLAAFFLLPAFFEKEWVRIGQHLEQIAQFGDHFLSWRQLFSSPPPTLTRLLHRPDYFGLGWAALALALPATLLGWRKLPRDRRPWLTLTVGLLLLAIYLALPASRWLWERLPLLPYLLYPWRLLGVAALALALLAGATLDLLPSDHYWRPITALAALLALVLTALPLLYSHTYPPHLVSRNVADALAYEARTGLLGGTSYGEYLPRWVQETPTDSPLMPAYRAGQPLESIERFDATSLPPGGRVLQARYGFNQVEMTLSSPQPFQARFHTFYFPAWQATVNGERTATAPVGPLGLIGLSLPAGESHLRLWFGDTPWHTTGKAISLLSAALLLALALRRNLWPSPQAGPTPSATLPPIWRPGTRLMPFALLALGLLIAKLTYIDRYDSPFRRQGFDGQRVEEAGHVLDVTFGDQLRLLGYDLSTDVLVPSQSVDLALYWLQQRPLARRPRLAMALIEPLTGRVLAQTTGWVPQDYPLEFWQLDWYTRDLYRLTAPADAAPGRYLLTLQLADEAGSTIGQTATLAAVKVPLPPQDARPEHPLDLTLGSQIALIGYDLTAGDPLHLTLYWRCLAAPTDDYTVFVHLLDAQGNIAVQADSQPRGGVYPTAIWTPGEVIPDEFVLPTAGLAAGDYRLAVGLYHLASSQRLPMTDANGERLPDDRLLLPVRQP